MNGLRHIQWRQFVIVLVVSSVLFGALSISRLHEVVDIFYPRAVLKLNNFHSREYAITTPSTILDVAASAANEWQAVVPDTPALAQFRVITFRIDALPAPYTRRLLAVFINNARILDVKDTGRTQEYGVIIPSNVRLDAGAVIRIATIPDDKATPPPLHVQQVMVSNATIYRWSKGDSSVHFLGSGGGWWQFSGTMLIQHPDKQPFSTTIRVNDFQIGQLPVSRSGFRQYHLLVPPTVYRNGDLEVAIQSDTWGGNAQDVRVLGVAISRIQMTPVQTPWWHIGLPWRLASLIVLALLAALAAHLVALPVTGVGVCVSLGLALAMVFDRTYLAMWYPQLIVLVVVSIAIIPLCYRVFHWVEESCTFTPTTQHLLIALVVASIWIKGGGILYPIMRPIDIAWHMDKVRELLTTGDFAKFYQPGGFSESVMPITEWGENRPMIPYSPFYHFSALAYALFPWPLEKTATILNAIFDASRIMIIAIIARHSGLSNRTAWLSALMYAVTPVTFLLHAWGNAPTTIGLWWTLISTTTLLVLSGKLQQRKIFALLVALNTATMLIYTVTAVFHIMFISVLVFLIWILPAHPARPLIKPMLWVVYGGLGVATVIYYGQYIPPIIERTIPYFLQAGDTPSNTPALVQESFAHYLYNFVPALRYDFVQNPYLYQGIFMPLLVVIPGFLLLRKYTVLWVFAAAWFSVGVLFMVAGYRIPMVDKQIFYILPILMICWGIVASQWWRRGWSGQLLVTIATMYTMTSALYLWVIRIERAPLVIP